MTRKDYVLLAAALNAAFPPEHTHTAALHAVRITAWEECVLQVSAALSRDNPRFDRMRFLNAADPRKLA